MADFTVEAKRVKAGQSLTDMNSQGMSAVNQLKALKVNIVALKTAVNNEADYTEEDAVFLLLDYLEKENVVIKRSDFIDDDKELGSHLIFVTVLPKQVVTKIE